MDFHEKKHDFVINNIFYENHDFRTKYPGCVSIVSKSVPVHSSVEVAAEA